MNKNLFLLIIGMIIGGLQVSATPKNFIMIFTDDQGYEDLGCFGSTRIKTPNIDRLAAEGTKLTSFYTASSVCSPSRAALLTGRMPKRAGVPNVLFPYSQNGLPEEEVTIAEMFKAGVVQKDFGRHSIHHENFINAVLGKEKTRSPFSVVGPLCQMFALGCIAQRLGGEFEFDRKTKEITNNTLANSLLKDEVRKGWEQYYAI